MAPQKDKKKRSTEKPKAVFKARVAKLLRVRRFRNGLFNVKPTGEYLKLAKENSAQSPLLRLPAEIRTQILEYIMDYDQERIALRKEGAFYRCSLINKIKNRMSLLRVCRQIYTESALSFFQKTRFSLRIYQLNKWMRILRKAQQEAVSYIILDFSVYTGLDFAKFFGRVITDIQEGLRLLSNIKTIEFSLALYHSSSGLSDYDRNTIFTSNEKIIRDRVGGVSPSAEVIVTQRFL